MFTSFFKKSNTSSKDQKSVFIHIPKCGGSTFVGLLMDSVKQQNFDPSAPSHKIDVVGNTQIMHIDFNSNDRIFKAPSIFDSNRNQEFHEKKLFMLFRDPVERIISEFNFQYHILNGKNGDQKAAILSKLKQKPNSLEEYIGHKETQNYQTKFLLGRALGNSQKVQNSDLEIIIQTIEKLPIYCGITDQYASFLNLFQEKTGVKLKKKVLVRKKTPFLYHAPISEETKKRIIALNAIDFALYEYIKDSIRLNNSRFVFQEKDQFIV
jgi:hypothetical protein